MSGIIQGLLAALSAAKKYELYSWGRNQHGQLGVNDILNKSSPVQIGSLDTWEKIALGRFHSLAIKTDKTLWSWGFNRRFSNLDSGQLGDNTSVSRSSPVQIGALADWSAIGSAQYTSFAIKENGTFWSWGRPSFGASAHGDLIYRSSPVQVGALTDWAQVSGGNFNACAIKTDGTLWSWGINSEGQLGDSTRVDRSSPVQIGALTDWAQVTASVTCAAIKTNGTLWTWGNNSYGKLGDGNSSASSRRSSPSQVGALTDWAQISGGNLSFAAVKTDGTLWAWGRNNVGQLGTGNVVYRFSPVQVGALTTWSQVAVNYDVVKSVQTDGTLWAWGWGSNGAIGYGDNISRSSPVQIGGLSTWFSVAQGNSAQHSLANTES